MQKLSSVIFGILLISVSILTGQSPHGQNLKIDCNQCHSPESWSYNSKTAHFSHDSTDFALTGHHSQLDCRSCHGSLEFDQVQNQCNSCHVDVHQQSVGTSCDRCHTAQSWIVSNIQEIHDQTHFPLTGVHNSMNCNACHLAGNDLSFQPIGIQCIDCHLADFNNTNKPNHKKNNFSTNCVECHSLTESDWSTTKINHDFFPLEKGHSFNDCSRCHISSDYSNISRECVSCHAKNFEESVDPDHTAAGFSNQCASCHTTDPDWKPASFSEHDVQFPIYSGKHKKEWISCSDCHLNNNNYKEFTCTTCHKLKETADEHTQVGGYTFNDQACLACHPTGDAAVIFDHNTTNFPLTGAHNTVACQSCHSKGFEGTSSDCFSCHQTDFESSQNPDHTNLGLSNQCIQCHTTEPGWAPAKFDIHNNYYELKGAHSLISNNCAACHNGNYKNNSKTCAACHFEDYNLTVDPNHRLAQFPSDCASCHDEKAWVPSQFNHDGTYFPIYSGKHKGQWTQCMDCHINPGDFKQNSCITCHQNPETDQQHQGVSSYVYQDNACLACHPTGDADFVFDHNTTSFPLTGSHLQVNCIECHNKGFSGTSSVCVDCHQKDFDNSKNPDHKKLALGQDCASCHTTQPGWEPAKFDVHDSYYLIEGAHSAIAQDCKQCHNGDYLNTPNTCVGCHLVDFTNTLDPNHVIAKFPNDCASCHSQSSWEPSTFNHDGLYFPVYSGKHKSQWNQCLECHKDPSNFSSFTCLSCHTNPETDQKHSGTAGYIYQDQACFACHPTGDADQKFDHNLTGFTLTGAHLQANCLECHANGFKGTPMECVSCHQKDFDQSINPNHTSLGINTDCASCHTTEMGWAPARFDIHNTIYELVDAHAQISNNCVACHNGNYINTPNTCVGCHLSDYNSTVDPNHIQAQFPNDCASCHSQKAWEPSTFDHDGMFFPIQSGKHKGTWSQCLECHTSPSDFKQFQCTGCHVNPETDQEHVGINGYSYQTNACFACHPTGDADFKFDHNATGFPLTGAHITAQCLECHKNGFTNTSSLCVDCHQTDFDQSQNPNHKSLGISTDCIMCHTTDPGWEPAKFDVHNNYYVLDGAHAMISQDCKACHNGDYKNTPNTCQGCHQLDYNNSVDPNHVNLSIPNDCVSCHTTQSGWAPAKFDIHNNYYELRGAHAAISNDCAACHQGTYTNTPNTCVGCHNDDFINTTNPDHEVAQFPTECATCHNENAWTPSTFNHDGLYFPIYSGKHKPHWDECLDCHTNPNDFKQFTCTNCHVNPETHDQHIGVGAYVYQSYACLGCHPTGEKKMAFDHNVSNFPLTGAHRNTDCLECHNNGFRNTPTECNACHIDDYSRSTNPSHVNLGLSQDCASCHTTDPGWEPARFDIHNSFYVLDGAHDAVRDDCRKCHNGDYNNTPNTCNGCHLVDYNTSQNPNHRALQIPMECENCHTTQVGWSPATFGIHDNYFVLDGAHEPIKDDCFTCHKGNYNNTPSTCNGCHMADFNGASNPNHVQLNIPTDCASCHTTQPGWQPATFDIHNNYYVLAGAHFTIRNECVTCHNGNYNNTPNTCYGCHRSDYENTSNPDHQSAQYPTDCLACHSQSAWEPSTFDHDNLYFPIYSGKHEGEWDLCRDCHTNPNDFNIFNCLGCHRKSETDDDHQGVSGYSYNSNACYNCHPDGEE